MRGSVRRRNGGIRFGWLIVGSSFLVSRGRRIECGVDRGALGRLRWSETSLTGQPAPTLHTFFPLQRNPRDDTQQNSTKIWSFPKHTKQNHPHTRLRPHIPLQLARKSASSNPFASDFVANLSPKLFKRLDVVSKKTFLPQLMEILQPQDYPAASHNHNPLLLQHLRQLPPALTFLSQSNK